MSKSKFAQIEYDKNMLRINPDAWLGVLASHQANNIFHEDEVMGTKIALARGAYKQTGHMIDFTEFTFPQYKTEEFHRDVCKHLDEVVMGDTQYLMLFAPPQHGKSELVSTRLPGFFIANNPDLPVAMVSYAAKLAERNSRNAKAVMEDPRYQMIFHEINPDYENWRVYDWHIAGSDAYALAVGVGGAITGHGFGLIIIDDPIENWQQAQSETIRENIWQWWLGTLKTRLWEGGRIIVMMTRWHKDDLAGRILEKEGRVEDGGRWKVLDYAALIDSEERMAVDPLKRPMWGALAPSRYSTQYLKEMKESQSTLVWNAEYQQNPTDPEGSTFKVSFLDILEVAPADICMVTQVKDKAGLVTHSYPTSIQKGIRFWDLAASEKKKDARDPDFTSGTLMAQGDDGRYYVLDQVRGQMAPEQVYDTIKQTAKLDGKNVKIRIEEEGGASGKTVIIGYQKALAGYDVEGARPLTDKGVRAHGFATQVNIGNVGLLKNDWNKPYISELAGFPNAKHDDQVDTSSGAFNEITEEEDKWVRADYISLGRA